MGQKNVDRLVDSGQTFYVDGHKVRYIMEKVVTPKRCKESERFFYLGQSQKKSIFCIVSLNVR